MLKAYWEKESYETEDNEQMAQTLSKIKPFEWVRIEMYSLDNIFHGKYCLVLCLTTAGPYP